MSRSITTAIVPFEARAPEYSYHPLSSKTSYERESDIKPRSEKKRKLFKEHWARCPHRKKTDDGNKSCTNNEGVRKACGGVEILVLDRIFTVYNVAADMIVSGMIDRHSDPRWFDLAYYCMLPNIVGKLILFNRHVIRYLMQGRQMAAHEAWAVYLLLGPWFFAFSDYYLLLTYPWVRPSYNRVIMQEIEQLSPVIEGLLQTIFQIGFHSYLLIQFRHHPELSERYPDSIHWVLMFSIIPGFLFFMYMLCRVCKESRRVNLNPLTYVKELFAAPLLRGRAPLYELLSTQQEISFKGMGQLDELQQTAIFEALECERNTVIKLYFDDENAINLRVIGNSLQKNQSLEYISFGKNLIFYDVMTFFEAVINHDMRVALCKAEMSRSARLDWLQLARDANPGTTAPHRVRAWFVHQHDYLSKVGLSEPNDWPTSAWTVMQDVGQNGIVKFRKESKSRDNELIVQKMKDKGKYSCCIKAQDGNIYAIPLNAEQILKVECAATNNNSEKASDACQFVGPKVPGKMKYECCAEGKDGIIYCIPYDASHVLSFNIYDKSKPKNPVYVGHEVSGQWKYACCQMHECTIEDIDSFEDGGEVYSKEIIFALPRDAEKILEVDTLNKQTKLVGDALPRGHGKYCCSAKGDDGKIYGIPYNAERVLQFDPQTRTTTLLEPPISGPSKYECCVKAKNGNIYAIPSSGEYVLMISTEGGNASVELVGSRLEGHGKYSCCSLGPVGDHNIYAIPNNAGTILAFDTKTNLTAEVGDLIKGDWKFSCCVLGKDGIIYAIPNNADYVYAFDPKTRISTRVGSPLQGVSKYTCCCRPDTYSSDDRDDHIIYGIPHDAGHVLSFNPCPMTATESL